MNFLTRQLRALALAAAVLVGAVCFRVRHGVSAIAYCGGGWAGREFFCFWGGLMLYYIHK